MYALLPSKKLFVSFFLLFVSVFIFAQAGKGLKLLEKGQYEAAKEELISSLNNEKEKPIGLYGLAQLYLVPEFSGYEPDSAMNYITQADQVYRKMDYKLKNKIQKDANTSLFRKFKKKIVEEASTRAEDQHTVEAYQHFLDHYPKPGYKLQNGATKARNELAYEAAEAEGTWQAMEKLLDQYGGSLKEKSPGMFKKAEMKLFEGYLAENGLVAYDSFAQKYPKNVYVRDSLMDQFLVLAKSDDPADYTAFINSNEGSPYVALATDSLASKLIKKGDQKTLLPFIEAHAKHERIDQLKRAYYHAYLLDNQSLKAVEWFTQRYPDYPFPEELARDKEKYQHLEFDKLLESEEMEEVKQFMDRYPDYPRINQMWSHFYQLYKLKNPLPDALDRFVEVYPKFPFQDRIEADKVLAQKAYFASLVKGDDWEALAKTIKDNPGDDQLDAAWSRLYELYPRGNDPLTALEQFQTRFPGFPMQEKLQKDMAKYKLAREEEDYNRLVDADKLSDYYDYLDRYPSGEKQKQVMHRLVEKLQQSDSQGDLKDYLERYPESTQRTQILTRLYDLVAENKNLNEIVAFETQYPDFPDKQRLEQDKEGATVSMRDLGSYSEEKKPLYENYIKKKAPSKEAMLVVRRMIQGDLKNKQWSSAIDKIEDFKPYFKDDKAFNEIYTILSAPDQGISPEDMGEGINTDKEEYASAMSTDGKLFYFCRNMRGILGANEDIYISRKVDGEWLDAKAIDELNTKGNEAPEGVSADGNRMILFRNGKLCYTDKTATGWSDPIELPATINKDDWQADARITADGKAILFSSGPSWGQKDIYVSELLADGTWGPAKSLGPMINTEKTDRSPFLHPDMKTMYFSSEGRHGLGGLDVYVTKKLDDTWTNWSEPLNLGTSINTVDNDWGFKVTTEGDYAYFAVESDKGSSDIFLVKVPEVYQPERVSTIAGKLVGMDGRPVEAEIEWIDLMTGEVVQITRNDPETGDFFATLPDAGKFGYSIRKEGFFPLSGNIDVGEGENKFELEEEMTLATVKEMKEKEIKIPLNNLFFETASFDIKTASFPQLDRLASWIQENDLAIEIQGHTDNVGSETNNQQLSENRAKAVREYLINKGVEESKVAAAGYGENKPVASNDTEKGRASNRRVEIQLK
ncbi:MAG: hypothetical protein DHS20C18_14720 [Saprospiraceae bacterium]|nr:MAG: hypothetical protein DHS20C18_14720 [Saprospiraceae bacterium]